MIRNVVSEKYSFFSFFSSQVITDSAAGEGSLERAGSGLSGKPTAGFHPPTASSEKRWLNE